MSMMPACMMMGGAEEPLDVADVFSTTIYTGDGIFGKEITTGVNLLDNDGLVWVKSRTSLHNHRLCDTVRTAARILESNTTDAQEVSADINGFLSTGFTVGTNATVNGSSSYDYVSWTFRKAPKFFDVVTWTGGGSSLDHVDHSLDADIGIIFAKRIDGVGDWSVTVVGQSLSTYTLIGSLNLDSALVASDYKSNFTSNYINPGYLRSAGYSENFNTLGEEYVAYLFANDDSTDGLIRCGSYTGDGGAIDITTSWPTQYILIKRIDDAGDWVIADRIRGSGTVEQDPAEVYLWANKIDAEIDYNQGHISFKDTYIRIYQFATTNLCVNNAEYIYMAIRAEDS